jgi:hypothetical protein
VPILGEGANKSKVHVEKGVAFFLIGLSHISSLKYPKIRDRGDAYGTTKMAGLLLAYEQKIVEEMDITTKRRFSCGV